MAVNPMMGERLGFVRICCHLPCSPLHHDGCFVKVESTPILLKDESKKKDTIPAIDKDDGYQLDLFHFTIDFMDLCNCLDQENTKDVLTGIRRLAESQQMFVDELEDMHVHLDQLKNYLLLTKKHLSEVNNNIQEIKDLLD